LGIEGNNFMDIDFDLSSVQNTTPTSVGAGVDITGQNQHLFVFHPQSDTGAGDRTMALIAGVATSLGTPNSKP
jgi:hypothetical protein